MQGEKIQTSRFGHRCSAGSEPGLLWMAAMSIGLLMLFGVNAGAQQTTATLVGTLTDPNGSVVTKAEIKVINLATGASREVISDESGNYSFSFLVAGNYEVTITARGYKTKKLDSRHGDRFDENRRAAAQRA